MNNIPVDILNLFLGQDLQAFDFCLLVIGNVY